MIYNIVVTLTTLATMLVTYNFFSQIADKKLKSIYCIIIGALLFESGVIVNILLSNTIWINALYIAFINVLFGYLCFDLKIKKIVFYSIILDIFDGALEYVTIFLISAITNTKPNIYLDNIAYYVMYASISKTLYFLTCSILARFVKKEKLTVKFPIGLYFYPIVVICTLLTFWRICTETAISDELQIISVIISLSLFFSIIILFIVYQHSIEKENKLFLLQNEFDKIKTDKSYYDILEKQNQELRIYAHDAKKHLSAIRELNENPIIDEYVNTMSEALKSHSSSCHSGNHLLDVIINKYATECQIKNINFSFDVKLCNLKSINNFDLVAILDNLLDNAIEAAENSKDAFITFSTNYTNTFAVITISNSCNQAPVTANNKLVTTKKDKSKHGIGIKSVRKALKKYDGDLELEYEEKEQIFTTTVMLLCE